jgi:hypothetical protein
LYGFDLRRRLFLLDLHVDDNRKLHFVDVVTSGFMGLGRKHHLIPVEAITDETPGSILMGVDQQTVRELLRSPTRRPGRTTSSSATREHYGYG